MEETACDEGSSIESEFAATIKYIDLYLRQKTDLFLQHYVFEPFGLLAKKVAYLSVLITLLVAGTLVLLAGMVLLIATFVPLWAALLITGLVIFLAGGILAYVLFANRIILQTPTATEVMNRGKT
jgi:hypothetical protein